MLRWGWGRAVLELVCLVVPVRRPVLLLLAVVLLLVEGVVGGMRLQLPRLELLGDMLEAVAASRVVAEAGRLLEAVLAVRVRPIELVAVGSAESVESVGSAAVPADVDRVVRERFQTTCTTDLLRWRIGRVAELVARVVQLVIGVLRLLPVLVVLVRVEVREHLVESPKRKSFSK